MPVFEVWHARDQLFTDQATDFEPVARVGVGRNSRIPEGEALTIEEMLDVVFEKTNHIDQSWTNNLGVNALKEKPRSSSVGDLIRQIQPPGPTWRILDVGFREEPVALPEVER